MKVQLILKSNVGHEKYVQLVTYNGLAKSRVTDRG